MENQMENQEVSVIAPQPRVLSIQQMKDDMSAMYELLREILVEGVHYGKIPGTTENTLFKPGADKIGVRFRLAARPDIMREDLPNGHREYQVSVSLTHIPTGEFIASAVGSCSTMESKYRWRYASRVCLSCGQDAIIKGREEYGGGYICFARKGGCGAKYKDGDPAIETQETGRIENPDIADLYNTVLKMAVKRAHVAAILMATGASDTFRVPAPEEEEEEEKRTEQQAAPEPPPTIASAQQEKAALVSSQQISFLMQACKQFGWGDEALQAYMLAEYNLTSRKDIPRNKLDEMVSYIKQHPQPKPAASREGK